MEDIQEKYRALEILHRIAKELNGAVELNAAMQKTLKEAIDLLDMKTGWIWLLHPSTNSVFLAASHNLPPAFTKHPERLSGWCYCIDQYLSNKLETTSNISEITCTRLKDLQEGTNGLRFHATIPLYDESEKMGLLNVVSETSGQLNAWQLSLLHRIGELLSVAIKRTRLYEQSRNLGIMEERQRLSEKLQNGLTNELLKELNANPNAVKTNNELQYPIAPLTKRELEVLNLLKQGKTNKTIAQDLFISERTVKFHVSLLLDKLDAKNRTEAVQIALKRGIVQL